MDLFISEPELSFERPKTASVQLDEDTSMWPKGILSELFRQVPDASEYVPRVMMYQVDEEQGYGFGAIVISSVTDSAMGTSDPGSVQKKQVLIPVIVKQNMLMPLDLLLTKNKMYPLTGSRLREALFRPSTFELMTKDWGDQSLYNLFYPPGRAENDFASGVSVTSSGNSPSAVYGAGMKYSSVDHTRAPSLPQNVPLHLAELLDPHEQARQDYIGYKQHGAKNDPAKWKKRFQEFEKEDKALHAVASQVNSGKMDIQDAARAWEAKRMQHKKASLLELVAPTINKPDLDKLAADIEADPALKRALSVNPSFLEAVSKLAGAEPHALEDASVLFKRAEEVIPTHVAQFGFDDLRGEYWAKTASRGYAYRKDPVYMDRKSFLKFAGEDVAQKVDSEGTVTVSRPSGSAEPFDMDASEWVVAERPGVYRVQTKNGIELIGWVFPQLIDMDGTRVPMAAFTNGAAAAIQDQVVGAWVGAAYSIPSHEVSGTGIFYMAGPGGVDATVPVTILGREAGMDGAEVIHIKTLLGEEYRLKMVPKLRKMMAAQGDDLVMLPDAAKFLKLEQESPVDLQDNPGMVTKTAEMTAGPRIRVWSDGVLYGLGFEEMPKMAQLFPTTNVSRDEAAFALCLAGVDPVGAQTALTKAASLLDDTTFVGVSDVRLAAELVRPAQEEGQKLAAEAHQLRRYLLKEAAVLPDIQTVDSVLSLGFINPENVRVYVGHLPYLERALTQVCELTLASRLGLSEIPEFAAARACRSLNETCEGLRALALREVDESSSVA